MIQPGIDTEKFFPLEGTEKIPHSILYVGRVDKRKGIDFLIRYMNEVVTHLREATLYVGGTGKDLAAMKAYSKENGLEKNIQRRHGSKVMGFGAEIVKPSDKSVGEILLNVQPEDLIKFGLIPEFLGRLPVIATLGELNEQSLVRILNEPKNALVKQYRKLFEIEGVNLRFTDSALAAIAKEAVKRKSGARGLRAILEKTLLDIMYELPSVENVKECVISEDVVLNKEDPILLFDQTKTKKQA